MDTLDRGSRGFKVEYLQRLLNKASTRRHPGATLLSEDGIFGPLTVAAVHAFQSHHGLVPGAVGRHTWHALGLRTHYEHAHVILVGQPNRVTCWSAAATEILGNQSVGPGQATIASGGGLEPSIDNLEVFANGLGWRKLNHSPGVQELVGLLRHKPLWIAAFGAHFKHAVVFSGVYSDGDPSGEGTMFRIHDPWPVGFGRIYGTFADPVSLLDNHGNPLPTDNFLVLVPN